MAPSTTPRQTPIFSTRIRRWILASPPMEWAAQSLQQLAINALKTGPIPQHVGLVMDGNRRFARLRQIETAEGHNMGFEALAKVRRGNLKGDQAGSALIGQDRFSKYATSRVSRLLQFTPFRLKTSSARNMRWMR